MFRCTYAMPATHAAQFSHRSPQAQVFVKVGGLHMPVNGFALGPEHRECPATSVELADLLCACPSPHSLWPRPQQFGAASRDFTAFLPRSCRFEYYAFVIRTFGAKRCMVESNFPVDKWGTTCGPHPAALVHFCSCACVPGGRGIARRGSWRQPGFLKLGALGHRYSALFNALKLVAKRMRLSAHDTHMLFHGTAERVYSLDGNDYVCLSQPAEIPDTSFPEFAWRLMILLGIVCVGVLVIVIL